MNNYNQKLSLFFLTIAIFFLSFTPEFSFSKQLEVLPQNITNIPNLVGWLFNWGMIIAASLAVLALALGAFSYLISAGKPEKIADAKDRMLKAIIGLIITLSSVIIMNQINPDLTGRNIENIPTTPGFYLMKPNEELKPAPLSSEDTQRLINEGYSEFVYFCEVIINNKIVRMPEIGGKYPVEKYPLLVIFYPEKNFGNKDNAIVYELPCGNPQKPSRVSLSAGNSYSIKYKTPGIYLYKQKNCPQTAYRNGPFKSDNADLGDFKKQVNCIEILNEIVDSQEHQKNTYYGFIIHQYINFEGTCDLTKDLKKDYNQISVEPEHSSITIFEWNPDWKNAGDGVILYSHPFAKYHNKGIHYINNVQSNPYETELENIDLNFTGSDVSEEERKKCEDELRKDKKPTFRKCPGSIAILGNYLVVLIKPQENTSTTTYLPPLCQVFKKNNYNLGNEWITAKGFVSEIAGKEKIQVIPIKKINN